MSAATSNNAPGPVDLEAGLIPAQCCEGCARNSKRTGCSYTICFRDKG